jgi:hypothetical protein
VLLWDDCVAGLVIEDPLLSVCDAVGFDAVVSGTASPKVTLVCDCDLEDDSLEELSAPAVLSASSAADRLLTDAADAAEADISLM